MPTVQEYAQIANRVYARTDLNRTPVPIGWSELQWIKDREYSGFSAGVYRNGTDIVIAYTGTNETKWLGGIDIAADLSAGVPLLSSQVWAATVLYLDVRQIKDLTLERSGALRIQN